VPKDTCSVDGCERPLISARCGLCRLHYQRLRDNGTTDARQLINIGDCRIEGCSRPARKRGWCTMHYWRWCEHGDPTFVLPRATTDGLCVIDGCEKPIKARGWCDMHYARWRQGVDLNLPHLRPPRASKCSIPECQRKPAALGWCMYHYQMNRATPPCAVAGCERASRAKGLCDPHYRRQWRNGAPGAVHIRVSAPPGSGHINRDGYKLITRDGVPIFEHRAVMENAIGRPLYEDETVHHINGIRLDNRAENLELWSSHHPPGQRITDLLDWAHEIIRRYEDEASLLEERSGHSRASGAGRSRSGMAGSS
jgi:hypothetical protein